MTNINPFLQKRLTRRVLVALQYLALVGLVALWDGPKVASVVAAYALAGVFVFLFALLVVSTRGVTERDEKYLDERQAQLRQRSVTRAYGIFAILVVGSFFASADKVLFPSVVTLHLGDVLWVFGYMLTLPTAVLAWLEPDPIPAESASPNPQSLRSNS